MSTTTRDPSVASSRTDTLAVKPDITKFDGWTFKMNAAPSHSQVYVHQPMDGRSPDAQNRRTFHVARRGNFDTFIAERFGGVLQTVPFGDGEFIVAGSDDPAKSQGLLLWRGPFHEVQTYIPSALALAGTTAVDYPWSLWKIAPLRLPRVAAAAFNAASTSSVRM